MVEKKFKINGVIINVKRSIKDFFRKNSVDKLNIENVDIGKELIGFSKKSSFEKFYNTLFLFKREDVIGYKLFKFIKEVGEDDFDVNRYIQYLEYKKVFKYDSNSDQFLKLKFGNSWEKKKGELLNSTSNYYNVDYVSKKLNLSTGDAEEYVKQYKSNKSTSKESFIKRWGEEVGLEKFEKFQQTSKHTKEKYITQFGKEDGEKKWDEYVNIKKANSVWVVDYWLNRGYGPEEAEELRKEFHAKKLNTSSVQFWIDKGFSAEESKSKVLEIFSKKRVNFARASNESLKCFLPLKEKLDFLGIEDIHLGIKGNHEFSIYDKQNKKLNFYDFSIPKLKIIIEYNGEKYHPNPNKLTQEQWDLWECYTFPNKSGETIKISANEKHSCDTKKKELALKNDFDYLEIWSSDSFEVNWDKIVVFFKQKGIKF